MGKTEPKGVVVQMSSDEEKEKRKRDSDDEEEAGGAAKVEKKKKKKKRGSDDDDSSSGVGSEVEDVEDASGDEGLDTSLIIEGPRRGLGYPFLTASAPKIRAAMA